MAERHVAATLWQIVNDGSARANPELLALLMTVALPKLEISAQAYHTAISGSLHLTL